MYSRNTNKPFLIIGILYIFWLVGVIAFWGAVIFIAWHFISKFW